MTNPMSSSAGARSAPRQSPGLFRRCASRNDRLLIKGRWYNSGASVVNKFGGLGGGGFKVSRCWPSIRRATLIPTTHRPTRPQTHAWQRGTLKFCGVSPGVPPSEDFDAGAPRGLAGRVRGAGAGRRGGLDRIRRSAARERCGSRGRESRWSSNRCSRR